MDKPDYTAKLYRKLFITVSSIYICGAYINSNNIGVRKFTLSAMMPIYSPSICYFTNGSIQINIIIKGAKTISPAVTILVNLKNMHYTDVIMGAMASQITSLTIIYSIRYSGADQRKHQSSASLAFVWGIHRGPVNSPHKGPVTRKMFPFDDVIMESHSKRHFHICTSLWCWFSTVLLVLFK